MAITIPQPTVGQREQALQGILNLVVSGELRVEERRSESWIAERLELTRTPVREALAMLARDLLVTQRPQVGVWVRRVTADALDEILRISYQIEHLAVLKLASNLGERDSAELEAALDSLSAAAQNTTDDFLKAEQGFHALLCEKGGFLTGARTIRLWADKSRLFHVEHPLSDIHQRLRDNQELFQALKRGNSSETEAALLGYFTNRLENVQQLRSASERAQHNPGDTGHSL
jgi:DNA-binding GntR family transcriptional regulator